MKRVLLLAMTLLCTLMLGGCATLLPDPVRDAEVPLSAEAAAALPDPAPPAAAATTREVTLYFRYGTTPYLAPEVRTITLEPDRSLELTLLQELAGGPSASAVSLTSALPPELRFLAANAQGRTLFVTLSRAILTGWPDEPAGWASDPAWQEEVPLRRQLCMQSIVATLTENCDYDGVQMLVEQADVLSDSLRLPQSWFQEGAPEGELTAPMPRQDALLLTPGNTLRAALEAWKMRDHALLYSFLAQQERPTYAAFAQTMAKMPMLTAYAYSGGSVSPRGNEVRFTLRVCFQTPGGVLMELRDRLMRLEREDGLWKIPWSQVTALMEEL